MLFHLGNLSCSSISLQRRETKAFRGKGQAAASEGREERGHRPSGFQKRRGQGPWGRGQDRMGMARRGQQGRPVGREAACQALCPPPRPVLPSALLPSLPLFGSPRGEAALPPASCPHVRTPLPRSRCPCQAAGTGVTAPQGHGAGHLPSHSMHSSPRCHGSKAQTSLKEPGEAMNSVCFRQGCHCKPEGLLCRASLR